MFPIVIWGDWSFVWGGLSPPKPLRGDGAAVTYLSVLPTRNKSDNK